MRARPLRLLSESWLILLLATLFGASLAAVHSGLSPRIEANKRAETFRQLPALVLGAAAVRGAEVEVFEERIRIGLGNSESLELVVDELRLGDHRIMEISKGSTNELLGWVIHGSGQGYADTIEVLVGLSPNRATITGLYVLSQKETPALGDGITRQEFRSRFIGRDARRALGITHSPESDDGILALTAATISSQSVCDIVNRSVGEVTPLLEARDLQER